MDKYTKAMLTVIAAGLIINIGLQPFDRAFAGLRSQFFTLESVKEKTYKLSLVCLRGKQFVVAEKDFSAVANTGITERRLAVPPSVSVSIDVEQVFVDGKEATCRKLEPM